MEKFRAAAPAMTFTADDYVSASLGKTDAVLPTA